MEIQVAVDGDGISQSRLSFYFKYVIERNRTNSFIFMHNNEHENETTTWLAFSA